MIAQEREKLKTDLKDSLRAGVVGGLAAGVLWAILEGVFVLLGQEALREEAFHFLASSVAFSATITLLVASLTNVIILPFVLKEERSTVDLAVKTALFWLGAYAVSAFLFATKYVLPSAKALGPIGYLIHVVVILGAVFLAWQVLSLAANVVIRIFFRLGPKPQLAFSCFMIIIFALSLLDYGAGRFIGKVLPGTAPRGPNVVLLIIDTVRADHLSLYGYGRRTSPNLEGLAGKGFSFSRAFTQYPSSLGSHASIFTSLYPLSHCTYEHVPSSRLPDDFTTIAEYFKNAGYLTIGILDNPWLARRFGFTQGFDIYVNAGEFEVMQRPNFSLMTESLLLKKLWNLTSEEIEPNTRFALSALREMREEKFFLFLHWLTPHRPYTPPAPYDNIFLKEIGKRVTTEENQKVLFKLAKQGKIEIKDELVPEFTALYDGDIAYTDHQLGIILDELKSLGIRDSTLVIALSDHGENFEDEEPHFVGHGGLTEGGIHVPLVLSYPPLSGSPGVIEQVVELVDVLPTALEIAGIQGDSSLEGKSLVPLLEGRVEDWRDAAFIQLHGKEFAVRTKDWKLRIKEMDGGDRQELTPYEINEGIEQQVDFSGNYAMFADSLFSLFEQWKTHRQCLSTEPAVEVPFDQETYQQLKTLGYLQ